jgi:hypothetical protein
MKGLLGNLDLSMKKVIMGQPVDCVVVISPEGKVSRIWCMRDCVG